MKIDTLVNTIIKDAANKTHFARSVFSPSEAEQATFLAQLRESAEALPSNIRFFFVDTAAFQSTTELFRHTLLSLLQDPRAAEDDVAVSMRRIERATDESGICLQFECLLDDYANHTDVHVVWVLTHFDASPSYWKSSSFGWLRETVNTASSLSCLLVGEKPVTEITSLPVGSSPLHNIFKNVLLEGDSE